MVRTHTYTHTHTHTPLHTHVLSHTKYICVIVYYVSQLRLITFSNNFMNLSQYMDNDEVTVYVQEQVHQVTCYNRGVNLFFK